MRLSIRNQLAATVVSVTKGEAMASVKVRVDGTDQILTSAITAESADDLGLAAGQKVTVMVKSTDVALAVD